jgi:two-component system OmpR family response regulator
MKILFIEDDLDIASSITKSLELHDNEVTHVAEGTQGLQKAQDGNFDVIIADRMLPGMDGLEIIREMRSQNNLTPVLVLSGLGEVDDRIEGLQAGGDDYLVKPCSIAELIARLEVLVRRQNTEAILASNILEVDNLVIDRIKRDVTRGGERILLQPREFRLLEYFIQHKDQIVTRQMLLENVWNIQFDPQTNVVDVHISRLRSKIDKNFNHQLLETVRGKGYRLNSNAT